MKKCDCDKTACSCLEKTNETITYDELGRMNQSDPKMVNSMFTMWSVPEWEYKTKSLYEKDECKIQEMLNLEGNAGWELVSVAGAGHIVGFLFVFKRQKQYVSADYYTGEGE